MNDFDRSNPPFSLPLAPFEQLMLHDDRSTFPMVSTLALTYEGEIDQRRFEEALTAAVRRHPLLRAVVARSLILRPRWRPFEGGPVLVWERILHSAKPSLQTQPVNPIDIFSQPGLRIKVVEYASGGVVYVDVHHAACDGAGLMYFLTDLLLCYQLPDECSEASSNDITPLRSRYHFPLSSPTWKDLLRDLVTGVKLSLGFASDRPVPVLGDRNSLSTPKRGGLPCIDSHQVTVDRATLRQLRKAAASLQSTVNDFLQCAMVAAIQRLRVENGYSQLDDLIRMAVPVNLSADGASSVACNQMSYAFIRRFARDCNSLPELLTGIRDEMEYIRRTNASLYFLRGMSVVLSLPWGTVLLPRADQCFSTAVLSNIGSIAHALPLILQQEGLVAVGNIKIVDVTAWAPLRPHTQVSMVALTYQHELKLGLRFSAESIQAPQQTRFIELFRSCLDEVVALSGAPVANEGGLQRV